MDVLQCKVSDTEIGGLHSEDEARPVQRRQDPGSLPGWLKLCGICLWLFFSCCTQISTFIKALHDIGYDE